MISANPIAEDDLEYIYTHFSERSRLQGASVVVTGCGGFLGFYLLHFLVGYADRLGIRRVIGLDTFKLIKPRWIEELSARFQDRLQLYSFDISRDDLGGLDGIAQADTVIHMASIASPTFYRQYPLATIDANIWGLRRLLDYFKETPLKGFLFFSSSEIYGDPSTDFIPTDEEFKGHVSCIGPRACYDESKRFGETLCYVYAQQHLMPITVVRPFNNFGPGMRLEDRRVPADFARAIVDNRDIVILSDGTPTRTFCYVADALVGYLKVLTHWQFDCFNIGIDHPEISMQEFAQICVRIGQKVFDYTGCVRFEQPVEKEYLTHNPSRRCPNITKARRLLNFNPSIGVEDGVERFFRFLKAEQSKS